MRLSGLVMLLSLLFSAVAVQASDTTADALDRLKNMTQSFSTLSYDGVFVHSETKKMNSMRVRHYLNNGIEYESLVDLDGKKLEIIRIDDKVIHVYPDAQMTNVNMPARPPFKRFKNVDGERLLQGYIMSVDPQLGRIADREVISVLLVPRDDYRYGHRFWLDKENHFLLKHDMLKKDGELLERVQFTSVNFTPDLKDEDFVPKEGSYASSVVDSQPRRIKNLWQFDWLPAGFGLVWPEARALNHGTSMLLLSDGMSTVSVFVEPTMKPMGLSLLAMGATMAGELTIEVKDQLYLLTMVGEVPPATIEKLLTSFGPIQGYD